MARKSFPADDDFFLEVNLDTEDGTESSPFMLDDAVMYSGGDEIVVDFDPRLFKLMQEDKATGADDDDDNAFDDNLAEDMDEATLQKIASELIDIVERDDESRSEYFETLKKGLERIGIVKDDGGNRPFPGASAVKHPLIYEAAVQFQARSIAELFPSEGPVKTQVIGKATDEIREQADRVRNYMNYYATKVDREYYSDFERMLMWLPLSGCCFKKVYRDERLGLNVARYVSADDIIMPYDASSLIQSDRITHRVTYNANTMRRLQRIGIFRDVPLGEGRRQEDDDSFNSIQEVIDESHGIERVDTNDDGTYTVYEICAEYDLPDYEHTDENGRETGIGLPYVFTIDVETQKVLAIHRNWREEDEYEKPVIDYVQYNFLPGLGAYGYGLIHAIGTLNDVATGALRALLDSAIRQNADGGFVTRQGRKIRGPLTLTPGQYKQVDLDAEDLQKAFFSPPKPTPSTALFQLLGFIQDAGRRFASTTEQMVGDADNRGPVGTTVALIEQGSKVFSAIHKRCHMSLGIELELLYKLHAKYIPDEGYPYDVEGDEYEIYADDFNDRVSVIPVSDPNIFSATQRLAMAQAEYQLASSNPQLYNMRKVHERLLAAMGSKDFKEILVNDDPPARLDPVSENAAILMQKPVQAYMTQDHEAHITAHMAFLQHPGFGGNPQVREMIVAPMLAHMQEHVAMLYLQRIQQTTGIQPRPDLNLFGKNGEGVIEDSIPIEIENQMAAIAAQSADAFRQSAGLLVQEEKQGPSKEEMELHFKVQEHQQDMQIKEKEHQLEMQHDHQEFISEERRKDIELKNEMQRKAAEQSAMQRSDELMNIISSLQQQPRG